MSNILERLTPQRVATAIGNLVRDKDAQEASQKAFAQHARKTQKGDLDDVLVQLLALTHTLTEQLDGTSRQGNVATAFTNADGDVLFGWGPRFVVRFYPHPLGVHWDFNEETKLLRGKDSQLSAGSHALATIERLLNEHPWLL